MDMADRMVEDGYRDLGYEYVNIDVGGDVLVMLAICGEVSTCLYACRTAGL